MTTEEKAKAYDEALERAQKATRAGSDVAMDIVQYIFPELAESEDERIKREQIEAFTCFDPESSWNGIPVRDIIAYLEKQKEQKSIIQDVELNDAVYDYVRDHFIAGADFTPEYIKKLMENAFFAGVDYYLLKQESESCVLDTNVEKVIEDVIRVYGKTQGEWVGGYDVDTLIVNLRRAFNKNEQKPASTEDMPYITDEHFFEREPVDSFRYKLAKYMTQNSRKEESPDGYTYHISAETILQMAKEELLKRGVVQKPSEWSEEDEKRIKQLIYDTEHIKAEYEKKKEQLGERFNDVLIKDCDEQIAWLKSLRPSWKPSEVCYGAKGDPDPAGVWKPSEEMMEAFRSYIKDFQEKAEAAVGGWNNFNVMIRLYEQLKNL